MHAVHRSDVVDRPDTPAGVVRVESARGEPLVEPFATLTERSGRCLVLSSSYGEFTFDRERGLLLQDGQEAAAFDSVQSVDLAAFPGGLGTKSWSITLYRGFVDRIDVAPTGELRVVDYKTGKAPPEARARTPFA